MNTQRRVTTRIGEIYRTKAMSKGPRYLQLVAIDKANLNSDVIVLFDADNTTEENNCEQIAHAPVKFYTHTTVSAGVKQGIWEKIGRASVQVDPSLLVFKYYRDRDMVDHYIRVAATTKNPKLAPPYAGPFWNIWTPLDNEYRSISEEEGKDIQAEEGSIYPPQDIIDRAENGRGQRNPNWPA